MGKRLVAVVVGALLLVAVMWGLYRSWNNTERDELVIYGNVDIRQVDLGFRVTGRIQEMRFEEGDQIKKGQIIAVLGKDTFEADVRTAIGQMQAQEANLTRWREEVVPKKLTAAGRIP